MTFTITKDFRFSAAHSLRVPEGHPCGRLHGHNYVVRVEVSGDLGEDGMVVDFARLEPLRNYVDSHLDHRSLNEVLDQPTAENLAAHLWRELHVLVPEVAGLSCAVGVGETESCWAWYRP